MPGKTFLIFGMVVFLMMVALVVWSLVGKNIEKGLITTQLLPDISSLSPDSREPAGGMQIPTEVKYDSQTNLEEELERINPQVLDEDFKLLDGLILTL